MNILGTADNETTSALYWKTVFLCGVIFGVSAFLLKTLLTYVRLGIGSQSPYIAVYLIAGAIMLAWFIKACGGFFVSWYFSKNAGSPINMGRAAMMGFIAGIAITIVVIIVGNIWHLIDPGFTQQKLHSDITIINLLDIPHDQKQLFIKSVTEGLKGFKNPGKQLFSGIFSIAVPTLITAMIGAKIVGRKKDK